MDGTGTERWTCVMSFGTQAFAVVDIPSGSVLVISSMAGKSHHGLMTEGMLPWCAAALCGLRTP